MTIKQDNLLQSSGGRPNSINDAPQIFAGSMLGREIDENVATRSGRVDDVFSMSVHYLSANVMLRPNQYD